ncbi:hypothetical protein GCK72_011399 [Caenorhabditis remanei]|uniref:DUF38 domain-containing protein n=1 Tax=Caenorhabditis remanei TaxID=31234 RepID=A0A6A5H9M7_CAERE|nr:hypothetical protein GCK72_011399 [Caenorhabditis remanei]KAF1763133.1 hypothetical protein GCK72_011399 [Caenorhabditis remanei]
MSLVFNLDVVVEDENPEVTLAQILNVPDFVEKYLDIDTKLCLRATCTIIREIINKKQLYIDCLNYKCNGKIIEISTNRGFNVSYEIIKKGLIVKYWNKEKVINTNNDEENVERIQRDLMSILCSEKLRIDTFGIEDNVTTEYHHEPHIGMIVLKNTLNQVPNKLKIKSLEYFVEELDEVLLETLKTIDPENLEFLKLRVTPFMYNCTPIWRDVYNLEQWKRLKTIDVRFPQLKVPHITRFFTHVENVHLKTDYFNGFIDCGPVHHFVMELIDKLLENSTLKQLKIRVDEAMSDTDFEDINESLQQYNTSNVPYP